MHDVAKFSFVDVADYPVVYLTAQVALVRRVNLRPGEILLVHGAAGGMGLATVGTGKALGETVVATTSSQSKLIVAKAAGADQVVAVRDGTRKAVLDLPLGAAPIQSWIK